MAKVIPVDQTTTGASGNCFSACVASILELTIDDVPQFMTVGVNEGDGVPNDDGLAWWRRFARWCDDRGVDYHCYNDPAGPAPPGYSIKSGRSPRNPERYHAVVALDGELAHDPHAGDRRGVGEHLDYITVAWRRK